MPKLKKYNTARENNLTGLKRRVFSFAKKVAKDVGLDIDIQFGTGRQTGSMAWPHQQRIKIGGWHLECNQLKLLQVVCHEIAHVVNGLYDPVETYTSRMHHGPSFQDCETLLCEEHLGITPRYERVSGYAVSFSVGDEVVMRRSDGQGQGRGEKAWDI